MFLAILKETNSEIEKGTPCALKTIYYLILQLLVCSVLYVAVPLLFNIQCIYPCIITPKLATIWS